MKRLPCGEIHARCQKTIQTYEGTNQIQHTIIPRALYQIAWGAKT